MISIHAPARGATKEEIAGEGGTSFQSTPPRGERRDIEVNHLALVGISIHAPARGATTFTQSPFLPDQISIHAPARGATSPSCHPPRPNHISIHAPARGATISPPGIIGCAYYFNPRAREGSDIPISFSKASSDISIHAPARGATHPKRYPSSDSIFQSTLPRGERLVAFSISLITPLFQSTLPRGERRQTTCWRRS